MPLINPDDEWLYQVRAPHDDSPDEVMFFTNDYEPVQWWNRVRKGGGKAELSRVSLDSFEPWEPGE